MKRIFLLFLLLPLIFLSFFFIKDSISLAQEEDPETIAEQGYGQICLNAVFYDTDKSVIGWCGVLDRCTKGKTGGIDYPACEKEGHISRCTYSRFPKDGANFELKGSGFPPGAKVYPYYCASPVDYKVPFEPYCTSGNPNIDKIIFGGEVTGPYSLTFQYEGATDGAFFSNANGDLTVNGKISNATQYVSYVFYGFYIIPPMGQGGETVEGENKTQQLGTMPFAKFMTENTEKNCVAISWDPFGRVFDSKSLEPMEGINVRLLSSISPETLTYLTRGQNNPEATGVNGVFNFVVPEGIYYLRLANLPSTHLFINSPNLNPLYKDIYYKNIDGKSSLYQPDEEIRELIDTPDEEKRGAPDLEERDIPLDPGVNSLYLSQIRLMQNSTLQLGNVDASIYRGQSSHPYPIVSFVRADNRQLIFEKEMTDKNSRYGFWKVVIPNEIIPADTPLEVVLKKNPKYFSVDNDLATSKDGFSFEPILRYVKGYVTDGSGRTVEGAEVNVRLKMNNAIYSMVRANDEGLIEIPSNRLPLFSYYLEIKVPNSSVKITKNPSTFVKENEDYLEKEKLNLMTGAKNDQSVVDRSKLNPDQQKTNRGVNKNLIIIGLILFLLIAVTAGMVLYIKKKQI